MVPPAYHDGLFLARRASVRGRVVRAGRARIWRGYGQSPSAKPEQIQLTTEYLRPGVTTATVYSLCAHGRLAHVRILNVIRIAPTDLSDFIASCRRLTGTQSATSNGRRG
jgi:hypothetical protein